MSKLYTIPEGAHYAEGIRTSLVVGNTVLRFRATFMENCLYIPTENPGQINKLYGMAYGQHHNCSARVGWRSDGNLIEVLSYVYTAKDARESRTLGFVKPCQPHEYEIARKGDDLSISMDDEEPQKFKLFAPSLIGYRLYPYFGGANPAPHRMQIEIEVLKLNGIGA
jgi:hypothetical protein